MGRQAGAAFFPLLPTWLTAGVGDYLVFRRTQAQRASQREGVGGGRGGGGGGHVNRGLLKFSSHPGVSLERAGRISQYVGTCTVSMSQNSVKYRDREINFL